MSTRERKTFWACFLGWAVDAMDVQIYAVVMPTLIGLWAMSQAQAGVLGTSALLVSSLGGWMAGILADRIGRAKVFAHHHHLVRDVHVPFGIYQFL